MDPRGLLSGAEREAVYRMSPPVVLPARGVPIVSGRQPQPLPLLARDRPPREYVVLSRSLH